MNTQELKSKVLDLLSKVKRKGMDDLISYLSSSDYFIAPASTKFHDSFECGLIYHSYLVYKILDDKVKYMKLDKLIKSDSVILSSLLHDICKVDVYSSEEIATQKQVSYVFDLNKLRKIPLNLSKVNLTKSVVSKLIDFLKVENNDINLLPDLSAKYSYLKRPSNLFPFLPHGEESVRRIEEWIELLPEESLAIRYHMGLFDKCINNDQTIQVYYAAQEFTPLTTLLHNSDMEAVIISNRDINL